MSPRRYESPARTAQREATATHIVETALALVAERGLDELTIPTVAAAAEVSHATVYRHFPSLDDLIGGMLRAMRPRVGQTPERLAGVAPDGFADLARENFTAYEEHADVLMPLIESRAFNRVRVTSWGPRAPVGADVLRPLAPDCSERDLESMAGALYLLVAPGTWRWLRETWGLDANAAARASTWALRVLTDAIARGDLPEGELK